MDWWLGLALFLSGGVAGVLLGFVFTALCLRFAMLRTLVQMREMLRKTCDYATNVAATRQAEIQEAPQRRSMWD